MLHAAYFMHEKQEINIEAIVQCTKLPMKEINEL